MSEPIVFRILLGVLLVSFVAHRAYYTRKFPPAEEDTLSRLEKNAVSRVAELLSFVALISSFLYIFFTRLLAWAAAPLPPGLRWTGLALAFAGFALLEWSHRALAANWSDRPRITQEQKLVRNGPYRRVRHPIYTAFLLILGSTLLISANWLVGLSWLVSVGLDAAVRIRYEERALRERFGEEYDAYRSQTGALLPWI